MPNWHRLRSRVALRTRRLSQRGASLRRAPARTRTVDSRVATSPSPTGARARDAPMTAGPAGPGGSHAPPRLLPSDTAGQPNGMSASFTVARAAAAGGPSRAVATTSSPTGKKTPNAPTTAGAPRSWPDVVGRPAGAGRSRARPCLPSDTAGHADRHSPTAQRHREPARGRPDRAPGARTAGSRAGKARRSDHQAGPRRRFSALRPPLRAPPGRARPRRSGAGRGPRRPGR
jgi:hypothetical protein